jgi:phosphatidylserine/phosphatidylglycerophosphate/cardiolipin synthase-like enzyme
VHNDSRVTYLVDGRTTMLMLCRHFITAHDYLYLANWGLTAGMELVRGTDHRAGPDGSPAQEALLADLRASGFTDADLQFWQTHHLSVQNVLGYAVSKGVEVKVLLWSSPHFFSHYDPRHAHDQLKAVGVTCILDNSAEGILHHPVESLHQKITVVDGAYAFVGGVDPLIEAQGDFDRWDTHDHTFFTPLRRAQNSLSSHPWHDAHALIEGPAAADVEWNFRQRWNDVLERHHMDQRLMVLERLPAPPMPSRTLVQVARTIPEHTYSFKPLIITGIAQLYANALSNIQRFVYLENQYLWMHAYLGVDIPFVSIDNSEMEHNIHLLGDALRRGAIVSIILPDHPNVGRAFTDQALEMLRDEAPQAVEEGRFQAFCLGTSAYNEAEGRVHYRPIYVHAKVAIVDDLWTTVGSGNLNNRGMRDDTEMNVATLDPGLAHDLRLRLQAEHLGLIPAQDLHLVALLHCGLIRTEAERTRAMQILTYLEQQLSDPRVALRMMHTRAWENLARYKANQPLVGHLLPYLRASEAVQQGLPFREDHGWLEEAGSTSV